MFTLAFATPAQARTIRPLFEPTDLELEPVGVLELDLQFGLARSRGPARLVVPDFELDLGLLPNLEFNVDGAYAIEGRDDDAFSFQHSVPDSLWVAAKVGLYGTSDPEQRTAFALGVQLGPKLPIAAGSHGLGVEGLALIGTAVGGVQLVWNAGGFVDPAPDAAPARPTGLEVGVDADIGLDAADLFSLQGGVSAVRFFSNDPDQLLASGGVTWSPLQTLDLSLITFVGLLQGSDRYGVLLGIAPKVRLFR
jgi:hypothetical protein